MSHTLLICCVGMCMPLCLASVQLLNLSFGSASVLPFQLFVLILYISISILMLMDRFLSIYYVVCDTIIIYTKH